MKSITQKLVIPAVQSKNEGGNPKLDPRPRSLLEAGMTVFLFVLLFLASQPIHADNIIDLTHPFNEKTIYWPTAKGFELEKRGWGFTKKGYFYASNIFKTPEHGGTHMDAPIHFAKGKWTVDQIPVERLTGEAAVIDLRSKIKDNANYLISKNDIVYWEQKNEELGSSHIVLFNTGWARFWGNKKKYLGTDKFEDVENLHFPGLSQEAAEYLVSKKVKGVGLDTPSLDYGQSKDFWAHRIILEANIYGLENVANLDRLPSKGSTLYVAPMKIEQGTGAPTRILAVLP